MKDLTIESILGKGSTQDGAPRKGRRKVTFPTTLAEVEQWAADTQATLSAKGSKVKVDVLGLLERGFVAANKAEIYTSLRDKYGKVSERSNKDADGIEAEDIDFNQA